MQLGEAGADGRKRLADAGLQLVPLGANVQVGAVKFGSRAKRGGFESGWDVAAVKVPTGAPSPHWFYLPALLLVALVWWNQGRRLRGGLRGLALGYTARRQERAAVSQRRAAEGAGAEHRLRTLRQKDWQAPRRRGVPHWREAGRRASPPKGQAARSRAQRQSLR